MGGESGGGLEEDEASRLGGTKNPRGHEWGNQSV